MSEGTSRAAPAPVVLPAAGGSALAALTFALAAAMLLVVPLFVDPAVPGAFRTGKAELAGVLWAGLAACFLAGGGLRETCRDPWWLAWGGLVLGCLASVPASAQPSRSLAGVLPLVAAALGSGALRRLPEHGRLHLATLIVVAGLLQAVLAIPRLGRALLPPVLRPLGDGPGRSAWIGTLGNPADVAVFLVLPAVLALALALAGRRARPALLAAAVAVATVVAGTRTLSALAALAAGAAAAVLHGVGRRRRPAAMAALVVVAGGTLLTPFMRAKIAEEVAEVRSSGWAGLGSSRGAAAAAALAMVASHPLTGVGFGLFESHSFAYLDESTRAERGRRLGLETAFGEAHNEALQHAAETGLVGVLLALAGVVVAARRDRGRTGVLPDRAALLVAAAVIATVQFPLHLAAVASQWAVLAALALPPLAAPAAGGRARTARRLVAVAAVIAVALGVAWQRRLAWQAVGRGAAIAAAAQAQPATVASRARQREALAALVPRLRWLPHQHEALATAGNLAFGAGQLDAALRYFAGALELAERPEYRFDVGMALLALGERAPGLESLAAAVKLNPAFFARVVEPDLARTLRLRLDADGFGTRHPWMYQGTSAATP